MVASTVSAVVFDCLDGHSEYYVNATLMHVLVQQSRARVHFDNREMFVRPKIALRFTLVDCPWRMIEGRDRVKETDGWPRALQHRGIRRIDPARCRCCNAHHHVGLSRAAKGTEVRVMNGRWFEIDGQSGWVCGCWMDGKDRRVHRGIHAPGRKYLDVCELG